MDIDPHLMATANLRHVIHSPQSQLKLGEVYIWVKARQPYLVAHSDCNMLALLVDSEATFVQTDTARASHAYNIAHRDVLHRRAFSYLVVSSFYTNIHHVTAR